MAAQTHNFYIGGAYIDVHSKAPPLESNPPTLPPGIEAGVKVDDAKTVLFGYAYRFDPRWSVELALGIPPIVTNTYAGLRGVDPDLQEAGRGVGMSEVQLLTRVEVPVALPVVLAGIRSSAVAIMATTPLMSLVGADTLGTYILSGLALSDEVEVFAAALLVVFLALMTELAFALLERAVTSPGLARPEAGANSVLGGCEGGALVAQAPRTSARMAGAA